MVSKKTILLLTVGFCIQSPLWAQIQPQEAEMLAEETDGEEEILLEDMDAGQIVDEEDTFLEEEIDGDEEAMSEEEADLEEGNQGYIYGSALARQETKRTKRESLWQRIIKIDQWIQEKFW